MSDEAAAMMIEDALAADLERVAFQASVDSHPPGGCVVVSGLDGSSHEVAIDEAAETGTSLADKVRTTMALPHCAAIELFVSSDGSPVEAGATLASQGIVDGAALAVVVPPKAALTDGTIRDAVQRWFEPETRQAVVDEFGEIGNWDVSQVTRMRELFKNKADFNEDLSRWNTSNVVDMYLLFNSASSFNQPLEAWDTGRVEKMRWLFYCASSFNQPLEAWDTGRVRDMHEMFEGADSLERRPSWYLQARGTVTEQRKRGTGCAAQ